MTTAASRTSSQITSGVTGQPWRVWIEPWGDVDLGEDVLGWAVAAEDRWHLPHEEVAVRQHRIEGAPVSETRMRVPDGDAVQRVWSVADAGGLTVVEVENDSPLPFAVAFYGCPLLTDRPPSTVGAQGVDLPDDAIVLPVGHRTSVRVAYPHQPEMIGASLSPGGVAGALTVARGWRRVAEGASRLVLPDEALVDAVVASRCDLLLEGPSDDDALARSFDIAELVRLGEPADAWLPEIVEPVAEIARVDDAAVDVALVAVASMALRADDRRAVRDLERLRRRRHRDRLGVEETPPQSLATIERGASAGRFVRDVERWLADGGALLPLGLPAGWHGVDFESHDVPTGVGRSVSYAIRWHGERPAVLWEQHGEPTTLTSPAIDPSWRADDERGEALWAAPAAPRRRIAMDVSDASDASDDASFS